MLAIGRALMCRPRLLLLDEPSLGLAPLIVKKIMETIEDINRKGVTVFLSEQNASMALGISSRGYVMENGHIVLEGDGAGACRQRGSEEGLYRGLMALPCCLFSAAAAPRRIR